MRAHPQGSPHLHHLSHLVTRCQLALDRVLGPFGETLVADAEEKPEVCQDLSRRAWGVGLGSGEMFFVFLFIYLFLSCFSWILVMFAYRSFEKITLIQ